MLTLALAALSLAQIPRLTVEQYTLPNGLVVVLQPDTQEKLVALSLRYPVGSRHDPANQAGLAHLVEHLMFLDETHGPPFSQQLEALGGVDINAYTAFDHTEYRALFPPEVLPLALWLEARRMESLGNGATASVLASERKVVENEALQRTSDAAFGVGEQILFESIFPHPHPLHYLPIGDQEQLEAVTPADLTLFHSRHYGPKGASLVIAGNFNLGATKKWIEDYFSAIAPRERPRFYALARADLRAKPIFGPEWVSGHARISLLWAGPAADHAFIPSLEVFAAMLNYSSFSRGEYLRDLFLGKATKRGAGGDPAAAPGGLYSSLGPAAHPGGPFTECPGQRGSRPKVMGPAPALEKCHRGRDHEGPGDGDGQRTPDTYRAAGAEIT